LANLGTILVGGKEIYQLISPILSECKSLNLLNSLLYTELYKITTNFAVLQNKNNAVNHLQYCVTL